jgi:RNA polymerase sigma factor (sigma-70 family)
MPTRQPNDIGQFVRSVVASSSTDTSDGELLTRFIDNRDEGAFDSLVRRHAPMVLSVCRRLLAHEDAEDAFQATFLILALKAKSIWPRELLAGWLHGVARQVALRARRATVRRLRRERQVAVMPEPELAPHEQWNDLIPLLDQEITHLPERYRIVIVLCDLESLTRHEAALRLSLPEGTVNSRLARARALLAKRLTQRGVVLSSGVLPAVIAQNAIANVPITMVSSVVRVAFIASGESAARGVISAQVATLMQGVEQAMLATKLKLVAVVSLMLGAVGFACAVTAGKPDSSSQNPERVMVIGEQDNTPSKADKPTEQPKPKKEENKTGYIEGIVKEVDGKSILFEGRRVPSGLRVTLTETTEYNRETGLDAAPAKLSDITVGTAIYVVTKREDSLEASTVMIRMLQPSKPKEKASDEQPKPKKEENKTGFIEGIVKEIDDKSILLASGLRVTLTAKTEYLRETGADAAPAKLSDITVGTAIYVGTKRQDSLEASVVVIELVQPPRPKEKAPDEPKLAGDPDAVMKAMDGFRKMLPEPQGLDEMNGAGVPDINGMAYPDSHLNGIATRLGVKTRAECMALLTYLKDPDPKIRRIAAFALENVVKAYPSGMSSDDMQKVDSDGHRKMVQKFIAGIEKLPK